MQAIETPSTSQGHNSLCDCAEVTMTMMPTPVPKICTQRTALNATLTTRATFRTA